MTMAAPRRFQAPAVDEADIAAALEVPGLSWWRARFGQEDDLRDAMAEALAYIRRPRRPQVVACFGGKGGAGKTTTTTAVGSVFAAALGQRVVALDANPDVSTLAVKMPRRDGVLPLHSIPLGRHVDERALREYMVHNQFGLDAVISRRRRDHAGDSDVYRGVLQILTGAYGLVLADCGTSLASGAAAAVLERTTQLVLVTPAKIDGFYALLETIAELERCGYDQLISTAVVTINATASDSLVDIDRFHADLVRRCRAVYRVPFDAHLDAGGVVDLTQLAPGTRVAYARLAAAVSARFNR